jgi:hypothetical protein
MTPIFMSPPRRFVSVGYTITDYPGDDDMIEKSLRLGAVALLLASSTLLSAADYPARAIRVVIPWPPGGSTDIVGRILAADLTARLKQQVIIDNRAGAGSIVGLQFATAQPPDGYTFMMTSTAYGFLIDKPKIPVDLVNSFAPVALIGFGDSALVVHPSFPVKTVKELINLAKKRPGEILYASSGIGGFPHMNTELFTLKTGAKMVHVPFKGGGPAAADVMAGHTQLSFASFGDGESARRERAAETRGDRRSAAQSQASQGADHLGNRARLRIPDLVGHLRATEDPGGYHRALPLRDDGGDLHALVPEAAGRAGRRGDENELRRIRQAHGLRAEQVARGHPRRRDQGRVDRS